MVATVVALWRGRVALWRGRVALWRGRVALWRGRRGRVALRGKDTLPLAFGSLFDRISISSGIACKSAGKPVHCELESGLLDS